MSHSVLPFVNNSYATTMNSLKGLFGPTVLFLPLGKNFALSGTVERACALQSEGMGGWWKVGVRQSGRPRVKIPALPFTV